MAHFWELLIVAGAGGIGAVVAAALGLINKKKNEEIHILVNHRLDEALAEINTLKTQRHTLITDAAIATKERDAKDESNAPTG